MIITATDANGCEWLMVFVRVLMARSFGKACDRETCARHGAARRPSAPALGFDGLGGGSGVVLGSASQRHWCLGEVSAERGRCFGTSII